MNNRERFIAIMNYGAFDKMPLHLAGPWPDTIARWRREGLPKDARDIEACLGILPEEKLDVVNISGEIGPWPEYELKVLSEDGEEVVKTDGYGRKVKVFKHSTTMPEWLEFPVKDEAGLRRFLDEHYGLSHLGERFAKRFESAMARGLTRQDALVMSNGGGFYWLLRSIAGVENASYLFYDAPELVEELFERLHLINMEAIRRIKEKGLRLDIVGYGEDLAYKTGTLISPDMFRRMILPRYRKFLEEARGWFDVTLTWYDSDGDLRPFMEDYFGIGITGFAPCEVAASMDPVALRQRYGKRMRMLGGFDKRIIAMGKAAIKAEFERLRPVIREGGYLPGNDHNSLSADISWDNYRYFIDNLRAESGWC